VTDPAVCARGGPTLAALQTVRATAAQRGDTRRGSVQTLSLDDPKVSVAP
jgi:hypothetical protein